MSTVAERVEERLGILPRRPVGEVCPLCGGKGASVGTVGGVSVRVCCGCLLSWDWPCEEVYHFFYADPSQFHGAQQEAEGHPTTIARDAEHLRAARCRVAALAALYPAFAMNPPARLLDVGAGGGSFVAACKEVGWEAEGIEPCWGLAGWALEQNRNVHFGSWQNVDGEWEIITLHDVLEHLTNPVNCLSYLRSCLTPSGLMVVEIPEWNCPQARQEGLTWRHVLPKQHVCLYSDAAAQKLFARCGLRVEAIVRPLRGTLGKITYYLGRE